jgi:flavin-dependent dehydrogenase
MQVSETADAVVVGGGTVGAWCGYLLRHSGLQRVVLIEKRTLVEVAGLAPDRFDAAGNSRLGTDPIALPFPEHAPQAPGKLTLS